MSSECREFAKEAEIAAFSSSVWCVLHVPWTVNFASHSSSASVGIPVLANVLTAMAMALARNPFGRVRWCMSRER